MVREILIGGYKKRGKRECWESIKMQGVQDFEFLERRQVLEIDKKGQCFDGENRMR